MLFDTVPLRVLLVVIVLLLNALSNVPVEPLFIAAERAPFETASPEFLLVLFSVCVSVVVVVVVSVFVRVLLCVCVLESVLVLVAVLVDVVVSVFVFVLLLVLSPPPVVCVVAFSAPMADALKPKQRAMVDARSVFFMSLSVG
ncbi:hypothetical protein [Aquabacterium sp.]|uniref:hypothetical protein n=1 Tax=Aquabacterium sp. TaxID=1872578 RepID=UPI002E3415B7|nr:hypothetical protein [Aquabacterium sp.]HEX5312732.1 hypothetical protein [Aquabacterium sp.]